MNKQEAIEKIEELKKYSCGALGDDWISLGIDKALNVVKQLEEPEKPVVPQFVVDWYEKHKVNLPYEIYNLCIDYANNGYEGALYDWFRDNLNGAITILVKMKLFGYEVEKEKLYTAKLKSTGEYLHYNGKYDDLNHFGVPEAQAETCDKFHFTKEDLVKYHAWKNDAYDVKEVEGE